jgi:tetratricopeptide (TPR) repeat protein
MYTDGQGKFAFGSLGNNVYYVRIHDDRFYPIDERVILDLSVIATQVVQLYLTPRRETRNDTLATRTTGNNPHVVDPEQYRRSFPKPALKEFDRGVRSDREGKLEDAIQHYEKALSLSPTLYPAHNNLGSDYLSKSDFKSAQAHFEEAIKLNQSDAEAHLNLANVLLQTKVYAKALESVEDGLRRDPRSPFGHFLLGSIYTQLGRLPEAESALREALNLDPKMSRVRLQLVNLYLLQQKKAEASEELKAFLKDSPNDPLALQAKKVLSRLEGNQ